MKKIYTTPEKSIRESLESSVKVADFLPPPDQLVRKQKKEKITISIDSECVQFFKTAAAKENLKYQTMMNEVLLQYARHYAGI